MTRDDERSRRDEVSMPESVEGEGAGKCIVGHKQRAYECPGCAEVFGTGPQDEESWRWYRNRTSSKRIRAAVDQQIAERFPT